MIKLKIVFKNPEIMENDDLDNSVKQESGISYEWSIEQKKLWEIRKLQRESLVEQLVLQISKMLEGLTNEQKRDYIIKILNNDERLIYVTREYVNQLYGDKGYKKERMDHEYNLIREALVESLMIIRDASINEINREHGEFILTNIKRMKLY